jgi:hypothetical protein
MAKRCPSCGYDAIGPFTDNCPICAEPVRNVRSDTGGSARPSWLWWLLGGGLVAVLSVVGCCGFGMWRLSGVFQDAQKAMVKAMEEAKEKAEADRRARTVVVTAADLLQEFGKDPAAADKKYAGKYLEISGTVERSGRGRHDVPFVILTGRNEKVKVKIECFFDVGGRKDEAQIKRLENGQSIKVRGEYDGQVSNVQVRECILIQNGSKESP